MSRQLILDNQAIQLKLDRIAWQIAEEYYLEDEVILFGIKDRGYRIAELIHQKLQDMNICKTVLVAVTINKDHSLSSDVQFDKPFDLKGKAGVIIDDVLNSGITLSGVLKSLLQFIPSSVKVAVLANRDHKAFPVRADFVGISLATTLKEHISFVEEDGVMSVYLI